VDTNTLDRNERALDRLYRSLQANHGRPGGRQIHECSARTTLESAIEDLISWMAEERGFSVNYQINIRQSLERFAHWIRENGDKSVTAIRIEDLTSFLAYEKRRGLVSGSLRQITIALQMLFRVLKTLGDVTQDPAKTLEAPRVRSRLPEVLKRDEMRKLLAVDLQGRPFPLRDRAMLELLGSA
jgi:integrase/recombinase XerD